MRSALAEDDVRAFQAITRVNERRSYTLTAPCLALLISRPVRFHRPFSDGHRASQRDQTRCETYLFVLHIQTASYAN